MVVFDRLGGDDSPITLKGWEQGIRLAVDNLLENAAIHGARHVCARLSTYETPGAGASDRDREPEQAVQLVVDDDGPGIPEDERQRVLGRFERGRAVTASGSGLGLALVRQQAELHDGTVEIASSSDGGARVILTLGTHLR